MNVIPNDDLIGCKFTDVVVGAGSCIIKFVLSKHQTGSYHDSYFSTPHFTDWSSNRPGNGEREKKGEEKGKRRLNK